MKLSNKGVKTMEKLQVFDLEELLEFDQGYVINASCGPSHSCGGGR